MNYLTLAACAVVIAASFQVRKGIDYSKFAHSTHTVKEKLTFACHNQESELAPLPPNCGPNELLAIQARQRRRTMSLKAFALVIGITMGLTLLGVFSVGAHATTPQFDAAKAYKKCVACHGAKADKKFDTAKSDDEHVQIILKGKKAEKPPHMPGYESKGITADQAKALLDHMKSLKQ